MLCCNDCGTPTDGVELSPGCRSAKCPDCHAASVHVGDPGAKSPAAAQPNRPSRTARRGPIAKKKATRSRRRSTV